MVVLVTGGRGQLGQAIQAEAVHHPDIAFHFMGRTEADITRKAQLEAVFGEIKPDFCVNAAAYTAVDKAENEPENAKALNVDGARILAEVCRAYQTKLIHISTDFVFDGQQNKPYLETDPTNPQGVYGQTKRDGEVEIKKTLLQHFIIRTSWLYSQYGHNFMKTMLRMATERDSLRVVDDQIGTPTNANDLARAVIAIVESNSEAFGTYHFSNEGTASWFDFAKAIFEVNDVKVNLEPIPTSEFPTPAKRPSYSVLDKSKFKHVFRFQIPQWFESLKSIA
jgi:dTDP-4-dehydrorhamnose reductase